MNIKDLLQAAIDLSASDLHVIAGIPPTVRVEGELKPLTNYPVMTTENVNELLKETLSSEQYARISVDKEIDLSYPFSEKARFRVNAYMQKGAFALEFRKIPLEIPTIDFLNLPKVIHSLTSLKQGLVLVTGPTGHGKSTTIAAILNEINKNRACHIVTIEDPIEFIFRPEKAIISQREMYSDTHSWPMALRSVLREDPDVVLVGEMRDQETIISALTVAETGHLVFATLHTNSASQSIDRIVGVFNEEQKGQVSLQLSNIIEAVISQRLIPAAAADQGRVVACELLFATTAVKTAIRENKTHLIDGILETSAEAGMVTLERSLADLVREGKITLDVAQNWSLRPELLSRLIRVS